MDPAHELALRFIPGVTPRTKVFTLRGVPPFVRTYAFTYAPPQPLDGPTIRTETRTVELALYTTCRGCAVYRIGYDPELDWLFID